MDNDDEHADELLKKSITHVRVLHDFRGSNNDELCMKKNDIITLTQTPSGGWWEGTLDGNTGWFPENYTTPFMNDDPDNLDFGSIDFAVNGSGSEPQSGHYLNDVSSSLGDSFSELDSISENRLIVIRDIHRSEAKFIESIQDTIDHLLKPLHQSKILLNDHEMNGVMKAITNICTVHHHFLSQIEKLENVHPKESRIGGLFLQFAPQLKESHFEYCQFHSKFVHLIEQHKKEICDLFSQSNVPQNIVSSCFNMQNSSSLNSTNMNNTNVMITSSLSITFRRLDNYPALLQELQRYTDESHVDRGDTQRAGFLYREIAMSCLELRRQKEMEIEVLLGNIRNFDGLKIETYGNIQKMEPVTILILPPWTEPKKDCFLVLFDKVLMVLSVGHEMTSFSYESMLQIHNSSMPEIDFNQSFNEYQLEIQGYSAHPLSDSDLILTYIIQFNNEDSWKEYYFILSKHIRIIHSPSTEQQFVQSSSSSSSLRISANNQNSSTSQLLASSSSSISSPQSLTVQSPKKSFSSVIRPTSSPPLPPIPPLPQHRITPQQNIINYLDFIPKRTSYWSDKCLSSHVPYRPTKFSTNNDFGTTNSTLDHNEESNMLSVIGAYCKLFGGNQNKTNSMNVEQHNLVQIHESSGTNFLQTRNWAKRQKKDLLDKSLQSLAFKLGKLSTSNSTFERTIMFDIYEQLRQIRNEINTLSDSLREERKMRKRLQQIVLKKD